MEVDSATTMVDSTTTMDAQNRKRQREQALHSFDTTGTIVDFAKLRISFGNDVQIVKSAYNPTNKGILKTRPILKNSRRQHEAQSPKKRRVCFDEKTLEELQREKQQCPPKRHVKEQNTPYHDKYQHLSSDDEELLGKPPRRKGSMDAEISPEVQFQFNVHFTFECPRKTTRKKFIKMKHKQLTQEEGQLFRIAKARLPPDDDAGACDEEWKELVLREACIQQPSFLESREMEFESPTGMYPSESSVSPTRYPGSPTHAHANHNSNNAARTWNSEMEESDESMSDASSSDGNRSGTPPRTDRDVSPLYMCHRNAAGTPNHAASQGMGHNGEFPFIAGSHAHMHARPARDPHRPKSCFSSLCAPGSDIDSSESPTSPVPKFKWCTPSSESSGIPQFAFRGSEASANCSNVYTGNCDPRFQFSSGSSSSGSSNSSVHPFLFQQQSASFGLTQHNGQPLAAQAPFRLAFGQSECGTAAVSPFAMLAAQMATPA